MKKKSNGIGGGEAASNTHGIVLVNLSKINAATCPTVDRRNGKNVVE